MDKMQFAFAGPRTKTKATPNRFSLPIFGFLGIALLLFFTACRNEKLAEPPPDIYKMGGTFIKSLPYFNPDSCVLLVRRDVPPRWQGMAYENLFLDGPEDSPLELGFKHLDFYEKNFPADTARAFAQLWRGRLYTHLGKHDSARACLQASYDISIRLKNYPRAGDAQEALANIYFQEGNTAEALRSFLAVYEAVKNLDSSQYLRKTAAMANLASAYNQSGNPREALAWAQRYLPLVENEDIEKYRSRKVVGYEQCGVIYLGLNLPDSAILMDQKALDLQEKYQTINNRPSLLANLGSAYLKKGDCPAALRYLLEAERTQRGNNPSQQFSLELDLAQAYFCLGRLDSAEMFNKRCLRSPNTLYVSSANTNLSEIYARQGKYKAAYDAMQASLELRQKFFNVEKVQEMGAAKAELELERTQHRAAEQEQSQKIARQRLWIGLLLLSLGLAFALSLFVRQRNHRRFLEQKNQLAEAREVVHLQELEYTRTHLQTTHQALEQTAALLALKNELVEQLEIKMTKNRRSDEAEVPGEADVSNLRQLKILTDEDWRKFQERFEQTFPGMLGRLKSKFPSMTDAEKRFFLLQKIGLFNREIAGALGISIESVWKSRQRLKKKLGLTEERSFDEFVQNFG